MKASKPTHGEGRRKRLSGSPIHALRPLPPDGRRSPIHTFGGIGGLPKRTKGFQMEKEKRKGNRKPPAAKGPPYGPVPRRKERAPEKASLSHSPFRPTVTAPKGDGGLWGPRSKSPRKLGSTAPDTIPLWVPVDSRLPRYRSHPYSGRLPSGKPLAGGTKRTVPKTTPKGGPRPARWYRRLRALYAQSKRETLAPSVLPRLLARNWSGHTFMAGSTFRPS